MTSETLTTLAAAEYRVVETDTASVDLMAGGRLWSVDTDLDPQGGPAGPLFSRTVTPGSIPSWAQRAAWTYPKAFILLVGP